MPSPLDDLGDDSPLGLQADEMVARQLDTGFAGAVRNLVHDPATGLAGRDPEAALGAVDAAIGQDPERAATLYAHARDVIQPERQAAVERKMERAREERLVTEFVGGLADTPDDPTRRPDLDDYQARAADVTPADTSPEVRAQLIRMAGIEQARADRAWQAFAVESHNGDRPSPGLKPELLVKFMEMKLALDTDLYNFD